MGEMESTPREEQEFDGGYSARGADGEHYPPPFRTSYRATAHEHDTLHSLRRSAERLHKIFEVGTVGIVVFDKDGVVVEANDAFLQLIAYSRSDLQAGELHWRKLTPPQWLAASERELQKVAETGHIGPYEKEYIRKDGSTCWFLFTGVALDEGEVLELVVDISERKEAEQALRKREAELLALNETLEERVQARTEEVRALANELTLAEQEERSRIAQLLHDDLQQRLYALQLQFEFLLTAHESDDRDTFRRDARAIEQELQEIVATTRRLGADLSPPVLHNHGLLQAVVWLANQMQEQFALDVTVQSEESFEVPDDGLRVLLFQAVRELLFNVVKHAGASQASVDLQRQNGHIRIGVQDDGRGFDVTTVLGAANGGMGLGTLQHRLQLVRGQLEIESSPGMGARVQIIAPLSR